METSSQGSLHARSGLKIQQKLLLLEEGGDCGYFGEGVAH
jgi:hypothetical protein